MDTTEDINILQSEEAGEDEGGEEDKDDHQHSSEGANSGQFRDVVDADLKRRSNYNREVRVEVTT